MHSNPMLLETDWQGPFGSRSPLLGSEWPLGEFGKPNTKNRPPKWALFSQFVPPFWVEIYECGKHENQMKHPVDRRIMDVVQGVCF